MLPASIFPTATFEKPEEFLAQFLRLDKEILSGVASVGEPAAYALVWEFGNARQSSPGPKTVLGTGPDGKMVWLSIQAPFGYIRINEPSFWNIIKDCINGINYDQPDSKSLQREFERAFTKAAQGCCDVLQMSAPVAGGLLRDSMLALKPGDPMLDEETDDFETFMMEG
jgi:hypothetical protein